MEVFELLNLICLNIRLNLKTTTLLIHFDYYCWYQVLIYLTFFVFIVDHR